MIKDLIVRYLKMHGISTKDKEEGGDKKDDER